MNHTYISMEELATRLGYKAETINRKMVGSVLIEGIHFVRPLGGRKRLFIWDAIERDMIAGFGRNAPVIPLANGGLCNG